jgi:hypothetical protein
MLPDELHDDEKRAPDGMENAEQDGGGGIMAATVEMDS